MDYALSRFGINLPFGEWVAPEAATEEALRKLLVIHAAQPVIEFMKIPVSVAALASDARKVAFGCVGDGEPPTW